MTSACLYFLFSLEVLCLEKEISDESFDNRGSLDAIFDGMEQDERNRKKCLIISLYV